MPDMTFAQHLLDLLFPPRASEQLVRTADAAMLASSVRPITIPSLPYPTTALLPYHDLLVQALIVEIKFHKNKKAAALLGSVLRDFLLDWIADRTAYAKESFVFVPVPLSPARLKERGYNQAEEIWKSAGLCAVAPLMPQMLARTRDTTPQTTLSRKERLGNMRGAFTAANDLNPAHTFIVFDDVTTTGATLQAAVAALQAAGATSIVPLALAH